MMMIIDELLTKYTFLSEKRGQQILKDYNVSFNLIDQEVIYDHILKEIYQDTIKSFEMRKDRPNFAITTDKNREVIKYYLSILVLKYIGSGSITKKYLSYFLEGLEKQIQDDIDKIDNFAEANKFILLLILLVKPDLSYRIEKTPYSNSMFYLCIPLPKYLFISSLVRINDPNEYQQLKLINRTVINGDVVITYGRSPYLLTALLKKLVETKTYELINKVDTKALPQTKKLETIKGKVLEKLEVVGTFAGTAEQYKSKINNKDVHPPCILHIMEDIKNGEHLTHSAKLLLNCYLIKKDFSSDEIHAVWKASEKYNEKRTNEVLDELMPKALMPYSCDKTTGEQLCFADDNCKRFKVKNPLAYFSK